MHVYPGPPCNSTQLLWSPPPVQQNEVRINILTVQQQEHKDLPDAGGGVADSAKAGGFGTDTAFAPVTPKLVRKSVLNAAIGFDCKIARRAEMSVTDGSKKRLMSADTDTEPRSRRLDDTCWMLETNTLESGRPWLVAYS